MTDKIRVLVAGEEPLMREGLVSLLKASEDIDIIGEAAYGEECVEKTCRLKPDVILMGMTLKAMNGFETTRLISKKTPKTKVVILADRVTVDTVARAFLVGAHGCVPRTATSADLRQAISRVHSGEMYLHPSLTKTFVDAFLSSRDIETITDPYEQLTDREKQVLRLVAEGRTSREIAQELGIAVKTTYGHRNNIMNKLGIHCRTDLIRYAIRKGLITLDT